VWRLVFVLYLLNSSAVLAGEIRRSVQIGIAITGKSNSSAINPKPAVGTIAEPEVSVPRPMDEPAAIGPRDIVPSTR
jgi:hypothetical protein